MYFGGRLSPPSPNVILSRCHVAFGTSPPGAGLFEVLIEVPSFPECHYVREMQKSTKSPGGRDRGQTTRAEIEETPAAKEKVREHKRVVEGEGSRGRKVPQKCRP